MKVDLFDIEKRKLIPANITKASFRDMPLRKSGWQFNWKQLYKTEGAGIFKLTLLDSPSDLEGLIMLSLMYGEMLYMNNIEIAPHNVGTHGRYDHAAACLIAYGCQQSFENGKGAYTGFLTFESKTKLIPLYQQKYGAKLTIGQRMFIGPEEGLSLIQQHLID